MIGLVADAGADGGAAERARIRRARRLLLAWFAREARAYPWRATRDPYRTLVAEVMLQQTQTARVAPIYPVFLARFPTVERLAAAPASAVIGAWKGLGYNRRAINLQRAARAVVSQHEGVFPGDVAALRRLPGIGDYTAAAVACFAFDRQVPVVDVNVRRVLSRVALGVEGHQTAPRTIAALAGAWLAPGRAYEWNQALMDLGARLCRSGRPACRACPLAQVCAYRATGANAAPPARPPRSQPPFEGSARQRRGAVVDLLRGAGDRGMTLASVARALAPSASPDLDALVALLRGLERDGLVELSEAARLGSPRARVRLPA